jgi:hypothetical protein
MKRLSTGVMLNVLRCLRACLVLSFKDRTSLLKLVVFVLTG